MNHPPKALLNPREIRRVVEDSPQAIYVPFGEALEIKSGEGEALGETGWWGTHGFQGGTFHFFVNVFLAGFLKIRKSSIFSKEK